MIAPRGAAALGVVGLVAALGLAGLRHLPAAPPLQAAEDLLLDLRFRLRGPRPPSEDVLIVAIDEADVARIGLMAPMRAALAQATPLLLAGNAAAVVVDLLLVEPTAADARLGAALSASPSAILAVAANQAEGPPPTPIQRAALRANAFPVIVASVAAPGASAALLAPTDALAGAAALGHVNIALSPDRIARRAPLAIDLDGGGALPAAALIAARIALDLPPDGLALWRGRSVGLGLRAIPTDAAGRITLNHFGGPGTLDTVSLGDVLGGRIAPARIAGRAVFIGASAESLGDVFATPYAADVAGVEVLATLAANLIDDDPIRTGGPVGLASTGLALAGAALVGLAVAAPVSPALAAAATLGALLAAALALQVAFLGGFALDAVTVLGATALAAGLHWLRRLRADRAGALRLDAERLRVTGYLSPFAAASLAQGGRSPTWRSEPATIGFVDVESSVGIAENRTPEATAAFLADVQGTIARAAERHGGAVVERFGDGALVVFGFGGAGGAREALDFARALALAPRDGARLRVSLHHGPVALADLGGGVGGHVTVAGDTVNVAARLQDAARRAGAPAVAGRAVLEAAGVDLAAPPSGLRPLPPVTLRGRRASVEVWALLA